MEKELGESVDQFSVRVSQYAPDPRLTLLTVKGFIDTTTSVEFNEQFQWVLRDRKFKLLVDLKDVDYIGSAGWCVFVGEIKRIRQQKGDVVLAGMKPQVAEVFKLLGFSTFLKAYPSVEAAARKGFGKG